MIIQRKLAEIESHCVMYPPVEGFFFEIPFKDLSGIGYMAIFK